MQKENERAEKRRADGNMPFRFWLPKGEECEVIILDESLDAGFWRHEHNLKIDGKWGNIEPCLQETGKCPHCEDGNYSSLVAFLTVLVMRPYTSKKTGETKEYSKMFLCFKRGQFADFERIEKIALKKYGTLRGTSIILAREDEENSFSTGTPVPNDDGEIINDWLDEDALVDEFGHAEVKGRESGKVIKRENEDIEPFAYRELMPPPDADEIRQRLGGAPTPGSREESDSDDDDIPGIPSKRSSRSRTRGAARGSDSEQGGGSKRGTRTRTRTRGNVGDDDDGDDGGSARASTRKRNRSRAADPDDGDEGDDGDEPDFD